MKIGGKHTLRLAMLLGFSALAVGAQTRGELPPKPAGTPKVGEKAPDFTLPDKNDKPVKLFALLMPPAGKDAPAVRDAPATNGQNGKWALLVFYRGYW